MALKHIYTFYIPLLVGRGHMSMFHESSEPRKLLLLLLFPEIPMTYDDHSKNGPLTDNIFAVQVLLLQLHCGQVDAPKKRVLANRSGEWTKIHPIANGCSIFRQNNQDLFGICGEWLCRTDPRVPFCSTHQASGCFARMLWLGTKYRDGGRSFGKPWKTYLTVCWQ